MRASTAKVHADILKMCTSQETIERIKWFHAVSVFFFSPPPQKQGRAGGEYSHSNHLEDGLSLARESLFGDARFFVSVFPDGPPSTRQAAAAAFLAYGDDPRLLCWAARCGAMPRRMLVKASAERGYALGQAMWARLVAGYAEESLMWAEKAASQGDPTGMEIVASCIVEDGHVWSKDMPRAKLLWREAASLGHAAAQFEYARHFCTENPVGMAIWLRRACFAGNGSSGLAAKALVNMVTREADRFQAGGTGRVMYEIGFAFSRYADWRDEAPSLIVASLCEHTIQLYGEWTAQAKSGVLCWLWLSRQLGVVKDIRLLIADLIWEGKMAWSEQPRQATV